MTNSNLKRHQVCRLRQVCRPHQLCRLTKFVNRTKFIDSLSLSTEPSLSQLATAASLQITQLTLQCLSRLCFPFDGREKGRCYQHAIKQNYLNKIGQHKQSIFLVEHFIFGIFGVLMNQLYLKIKHILTNVFELMFRSNKERRIY